MDRLLQYGDILSEPGRPRKKHKVLGTVGDIVFLAKHSRSGNYIVARESNYTQAGLAKRIANDGWKLESEGDAPGDVAPTASRTTASGVRVDININ